MGVARGRCWAAGVVAGVLACVLAVAPSASADVPSVPASGGAPQCVPDKSTIAQCFPDKTLAQAIAEQVKGDAAKTGEVLTSQDVNHTTQLFANGVWNLDSSIASVQDLQVFTNLQELNLGGTKVSDASPLAKLTNLDYLYLNGTQVSDVSALAKLTNLKVLNLSETQVSDVSPLAGLTKLETLDLSGTRVSDVSPLAGLTNLVDLFLSDTQVSNVSPLAGLANLYSLFLSGTRVSDVSALAKLTNLDYLDLSNTRVSDVSALTGLTNLQYLDLSGTDVLDLGVLHGLPLSNGCGYFGCATFTDLRPSVKLAVNGDGSVSMPAPRWLDGTWVAPSSTSPAGGTLDAKRGVVTWKKYDAGASYSYDFKKSFTLNDGGAVEFSGRVSGVKPAAPVTFRDVSSSTPHASDIAWLADAGVSTGWREADGSYSFRGMDSVKRQDMAAFLRREARRLGVGDAASWTPSDADWRRFRDVTRDTPHAEDVLWLAHAGVSTGYADGTFGGMLPVYRQDMAAFLHRLDNLKK